MSSPRWTTLFVLTLASLASDVAWAQIKVVKKPPPPLGPDQYVVYDHWVSSWGLRDDPPDEYPMGITGHRTLAEATAAAQAHMNRTRGNGYWAVTHYLIEGEPSVRSKQGPSFPDAEHLEKDVLAAIRGTDQNQRQATDSPLDSSDAQDKLFYDTFKSLNKVLTKDALAALRGKANSVSAAYRRANEAKKLLVRNVDRLNEQNFQRINGLIGEYNGLVDTYSREDPGREYFAALPRIQPVGTEFVERLKPWDEAAEKRADLERRKQELDAAKQQLDVQREQLVDGVVAQEDEETRLKQHASSLGDAPALIDSEWEIPRDGNIFGLRILHFTSAADVTGMYNVEADRRAGKWRSLGGNQIQLDIGGPIVATIRGNQMLVGRVTLNLRKAGRPAPEDVDRATRERQRHADAHEALSRRQATHAAAVERYKTELASYNARLREYELLMAEQQQRLDDLAKTAYAPPRPTPRTAPSASPGGNEGGFRRRGRR